MPIDKLPSASPKQNLHLPPKRPSKITSWIHRILESIRNLGARIASCCGHFPRGRERASLSLQQPTSDKTTQQAQTKLKVEKTDPVGQNVPSSRSEQLIAFYQGTGRDALNRSLEEILKKEDRWLEKNHDYIQWLFPSPLPSQYATATSPLLDSSFIEAFQQNPIIQENWKRAFLRILAFYGLELIELNGEDSSCVIQRSEQWKERSANWLTPENHNHLRISRILTCMRCLEVNPQWQKAFYEILMDISEHEGKSSISSVSKKHWHQAHKKSS